MCELPVSFGQEEPHVWAHPRGPLRATPLPLLEQSVSLHGLSRVDSAQTATALCGLPGSTLLPGDRGAPPRISLPLTTHPGAGATEVPAPGTGRSPFVLLRPPAKEILRYYSQLP